MGLFNLAMYMITTMAMAMFTIWRHSSITVLQVN